MAHCYITQPGGILTSYKQNTIFLINLLRMKILMHELMAFYSCSFDFAYRQKNMSLLHRWRYLIVHHYGVFKTLRHVKCGFIGKGPKNEKISTFALNDHKIKAYLLLIPIRLFLKTFNLWLTRFALIHSADKGISCVQITKKGYNCIPI